MSANEKREAEERLEDEPVASFTECTGLVPALPHTEEESEANASLYNVHAAQGTRGKYSRNNK